MMNVRGHKTVWALLALGVVCHLSAATPQSSSRQERFLLSVLNFQNGRCSGVSGVQGVCQHRAQCRYHGGTNLGACGVFGTCCAVERTCSNASSLQVSYFVQPAGFQDLCSYRVDVSNNDICQIRLDFEEFSLAQPTNTTNPTIDNVDSNNKAFSCQNDSFIVTSSLSSNRLPVLCGENKGQHMYVSVNRSQSANSIALTLRLADRSLVQGLPSPKWRIKVSQMECSGVADFSSVSSLHSHDHHNHWNLLLPVNDRHRIAPDGCLQYFIERSGTYETFNYNNGAGPYIGDMNYAICFRKYPDVCGLRHIPIKFMVAFNPGTPNDGIDSSCDATSNVDLPSQDYLYVPEGMTASQTIASKYCGRALNQTNFVMSIAPGPMSVFFRSDSIARDGIPEEGFRINYRMLNSGC